MHLNVTFSCLNENEDNNKNWKYSLQWIWNIIVFHLLVIHLYTHEILLFVQEIRLAKRISESLFVNSSYTNCLFSGKFRHMEYCIEIVHCTEICHRLRLNWKANRFDSGGNPRGLQKFENIQTLEVGYQGTMLVKCRNYILYNIENLPNRIKLYDKNIYLLSFASLLITLFFVPPIKLRIYEL